MTTIITYDMAKKGYEEFKNNPPESPIVRYFKEINYLDNLIEFAKRQGLKNDVFEYEKIKEEAVQQLKKLEVN